MFFKVMKLCWNSGEALAELWRCIFKQTGNSHTLNHKLYIYIYGELTIISPTMISNKTWASEENPWFLPLWQGICFNARFFFWNYSWWKYSQIPVQSVSEISSCVLGPRPWHIEIRHRVEKTSATNLFGFETLKLKIRRLKLWKPTAI